MRKWLKRMRAAVALGVSWALAWGLIGGFIMEAIVDPRGRIADMWPQGLAMTGFFGGVIFSIVLSIAYRRRRFHELLLPHFALLGAVAGVALGALSVAVLGVGGLIVLPMPIFGAASAAASLALARKAEKRELLSAGERSALDLRE